MVLDIEEINNLLLNMNGWDYENGSIRKTFKLKNFADALAFIIKIGIEAEKNDHHPDIYLHSWNNVDVILSTHSEKGITQNDINLAHLIDKVEL